MSLGPKVRYWFYLGLFRLGFWRPPRAKVTKIGRVWLENGHPCFADWCFDSEDRNVTFIHVLGNTVLFGGYTVEELQEMVEG